MTNNDILLLLILTVLLFVAAILKIKLDEVKKEPLSTFWKVQRFVFPVLMLSVLVLFYFGIADFVVQGIFLGIGEELVCWFIRKKTT